MATFRLSLKDIKAYTYCPLYYRFGQDEILGQLVAEQDSMEEIMRRLGWYILYTGQSGRYPGKFAVSKAYNRLVKAVYKSFKNIRQNSQTLKEGLQNGLNMLEFLKKTGTPVLISHKSVVVCGDAKVEVYIDGIVERNGQYKAVALVPWEQKEYEILPVDPEVALVWLAARDILAKPINAIIVYHLFHSIGEEVSTLGLETENIEEMLAAVIRGIREQIFFPSAGRPCRKCPFFSLCRVGKTGL